MKDDKFPYEGFETSPLWPVVNQAIDDLVENQDIVEQTQRRLIVGYILSRLAAAGMIERLGDGRDVK